MSRNTMQDNTISRRNDAISELRSGLEAREDARWRSERESIMAWAGSADAGLDAMPVEVLAELRDADLEHGRRRAAIGQAVEQRAMMDD